MRLLVFSVVVVCLALPSLATERQTKENEIARQAETAAAGTGAGILETFTNLVSTVPSILVLLLIALPFIPLLLFSPLALAGAGPAISSVNSALSSLASVGGAAAAAPALAAGAAAPGVFFRKQRSVGVGSTFWDILNIVEEALRKYD
ncbi:uncharacterized protein LOC143237365 [Tachypleus tridentatus]|uniref:uncharacterized protein LOC143237365 n=1 Tax=Tachypleus tridentatus TaxID=6853 RepID=UPI003FCF6493